MLQQVAPSAQGIEAFVRSGYDNGGFGECFCLFSEGEAVLSHVSGDGGGFLFFLRVFFLVFTGEVMFRATVVVPAASCAIGFAAGWLLGVLVVWRCCCGSGGDLEVMRCGWYGSEMLCYCCGNSRCNVLARV
ncbi:hypothetical protein QL285_028638 [Trifolium repens]|nr:hypothetical protein QL285_028638 [Trifolium repens]